MTILENEVISMRNKLSLSKRKYKNSEQIKRKYLYEEEDIPAKRQVFGEMINGYRSDQRNNGDVLQDSPVATLSNMGNTCFLNSVIYTLRFAPTFLHNLHHLIGDLALVNLRFSQHKAKTSSLGRNIGALTGPSSRSTSSKDLLSIGSLCDIIPKSKVQIVTEKLHELFITMHNLELKDSTDPYQPVAFLQAVREANSIFEGNNQQDAHELLVYLLDNIRETCDILTQQVHQYPDLMNEAESMSSPVNNSKIWNVRRSWKKTLKKDKNTKEPISEEQANGSNATDYDDSASLDSNNGGNRRRIGYNFVAEDFEGITLRRTKCLECESITERKEPFYDIPVPIISLKDDIDVLNECDIFRKACVTTEKLCDANKYLCENCERYNEASREVLFEKLPNIMVLQLKRFTTSSMGVQKVNTYVPTPLEIDCFCQSCCIEDNTESPVLRHRYQLCCVIMHLGGTMASGHYIAYVKASDHLEDYVDCTKDIPKGSLSASSSEKSLNILKFLKPKTLGNAFIEKNGLSSKSVMNGVRMCKSIDCCGVRLNTSVIENSVNCYSRKIGQDYYSTNAANEDMWLECDDESVRPLTTQEFKEELGFKANSTSTPYLLFYAKMPDVALD